MRIVSWNCNGKFREKYKTIKELDADVYVIQECENPKCSRQSEYEEFASNSLWVGATPNKGLGIFAKEYVDLRNNNWDASKLRNFLSVNINGKFDLLGVWAMSPYIEVHYDYQTINIDKLRENSVIIGDFNSNVIWDKKHNERNHSSLNRKFNDIGLHSAYHCVNNEPQGQENTATFYLYRKKEKPYHIDYCYLGRDNLERFAIGDYEKWIKYSDHMPLLVETTKI